MGTYSTITIDGIQLNITSATPVKRQKTIKSVVGKKLIQVNIIGLSAQQWEINVRGKITGTSVSDLSSKRTSIEDLDNLDVHTLVDGIHDGTYYVLPESLQFEDSGDSGGMSYDYSMMLVEE